MKAERIPAVRSYLLSAMFVKKSALFVLLLLAVDIASGQTQPSLDNGFKPYGSYDGSNLDSISLMDGNFLLHAPVETDAPQRGNLSHQLLMYLSSQNWSGSCDTANGQSGNCYWSYGGTGVTFEFSGQISLHRSLTIGGGPGLPPDYSVGAYSLSTWDGARHGLLDLSNGAMTSFETVDGTGYHITMSNPDSYGIPSVALITDRQGTQYLLQQTMQHCSRLTVQPNYVIGGHAIIYDSFFTSDRQCEEVLGVTQITDKNGNQITGFNRTGAAATDTLGRQAWPLVTSTLNTDSSGCAGTLPFTSATFMTYTGANGTARTIKVCYGTITLQTGFAVTNIAEIQNNPKGLPNTADHVTTVILADNSKWVFSYDSYGNVTNMNLPTGGSVAYTWVNFTAPLSSPCMKTPSKRVIQQRTETDIHGNSSSWLYHWGVVQADGSLTNVVTDPFGNDTVHVFKKLVAASDTCPQYETSTLYYHGSQSAGTLLKQVDTARSLLAFMADVSAVANPMPTDVTTTLYPSGKVSLVHKDYDPGPVTGGSYGNVTAEKVYDWGPGRPGALLREADTVYQWQQDSTGSYQSAHLIDLPFSVSVKNGSGCTLSQTEFAYDETAVVPSGLGSAQQLSAPPASLRGNQTSVKKYLWNLATGSCAAPPSQPSVVSHAAWYDTGELYQQSDPLGHTATHSYDSAYWGAYSTKTCNALNQCVSGTYDFNTGLLASFTDANGSYQASGATQGDPVHTTTYQYNDPRDRLTLATLPADGNGNHPQVGFSYPSLNEVDHTRSITATVNDVSRVFYDGLGRVVNTQHDTPSGTANVDTVYDAAGRVYSVSNPYFVKTEATYGETKTDYDALGRAIQTTRQDGSISTADYLSGDNCVISSDEAGKQRRACSDALGRLISVDEPGDSSATASPVATTGTQASAAVTITGAEQFATIPDPAGGGGGGGTQSCDPGLICDGSGGGGGTITIGDSGTVSVTVNQRVYVASFAGADTPATIAASLVAAINADSTLGVKASVSGGTISLVSIAASSAGSFTVTTSRTWDTAHFAQGSFSATVSNIAGGADGPAVFGGHAYTTLYTYDALGNLLQVTQQGGATTQSLWRVRTFSYDSLGRLLTANNPESGTISYAYDNDGSLLSKTDARGNTTIYTYDPLHRLTKEQYSDNSSSREFFYDVTPPFTYNAPNHGSSIGRLTHASNDVNAAYDPVYDALGRMVSISYCLPSDCSYNVKASAGYDLAGNMTSLTYPSGRKVSFNFNSGNQLDQVQFTQWAGASITPYTYWSASDANFYPTGAPRLWSLGNGVTESAVFNKRLQLQQETVTNTAIHTLMDHAFDYGTQNNGNVLSVADQLNPARTQSFIYDGLNRLLTANESRWGLGFVYDPWGNRLQQNVTDGVAGTSQLNVDSRNRITGAPTNCTAANAYCYDAAGDLLNDGFHQYVYDAESRIKQVDGGSTATYTYDADGQRVRKDAPAGSTEYVYFGGSIIAEKTVANGNWSDYVFAGGKRIARADSFKDEIAVGGTNTAAGQYTWWGITGTPNVAVRTGDKLFFYHLQQGSAQGGMILTFTDGTNTGWAAQDQDGSYANVGTVVSQWHARTVDLSVYAGKTINQFLVGNSSAAPTGAWNAWYSDIGILSADGTVTPIYTGQTSTGFQFVSTSSPLASNLSASVTHDSTVGTNAQLTTNYYHGDQIGSARLMTAGTGWPIWQGTFLPFGEEYNPQISTNHYKFTGKERDSESGLDYFGARYYGSALGRFITSDWSAVPVPVPYAEFSDPQSLNQYTYVRNVPSTKIDADGHIAGVDDTFIVVATVITFGVLATHYYVSQPQNARSLSNALSGAADRIGGWFHHSDNSKTTPAPQSNPAPGTQAPGMQASKPQAPGTQTQTKTNETGSYTNTHESGKTYSGKGSRARSQASGKRIEQQTGDKHIATDWTPSANGREAFKDESRRIDANGGPKSDNNHNERESPGKKYREHDRSN